MTLVSLNKRKLFTTSAEEVTQELVSEAVKLHRSNLLKGYIENEDMYMSKHEILKSAKKEAWKPDNRLVINYAKYIVDTFSGYQIGVPVKITHDEEIISDFIANFRKINDMEDSEFELAKMSDIFGHGVFDSVKTLINALNKAASEKANDVDYFADAYLKIVGVELKDDMADQIRENRIFNLWKNGSDGTLPDVGFLEKPNSDTTQENLIALLKDSIFAVSMVANLSEEDFGNASGTALAFKLQAMDNLAKMKDRKMQSAFNRLYEIVFNVPMATVPSDGWTGIKYKFTRNVPRNILEEAQVVGQLSGQVSNETKLSVLSIVDNPQEELAKMEKEEESSSLLSKKIALNERVADKDLNVGSQEVIADGQ